MSAFQSIHTARTTRRGCDECGKPLEPGQKYRRHAAPPFYDDLENTAWWVLLECWDCANKRGFPIDPDQYPPKLIADAWNEKHPVGTLVYYWNIPGEDPKQARTSTPAHLNRPEEPPLGQAVIWMEGVSGWWALSHVVACSEVVGRCLVCGGRGDYPLGDRDETCPRCKGDGQDPARDEPWFREHAVPVQRESRVGAA